MDDGQKCDIESFLEISEEELLKQRLGKEIFIKSDNNFRYSYTLYKI